MSIQHTTTRTQSNISLIEGYHQMIHIHNTFVIKSNKFYILFILYFVKCILNSSGSVWILLSVYVIYDLV